MGLDPGVKDGAGPVVSPQPICGVIEYKGDGYCDDENNDAGCDFDGGDCCTATAGVVNTAYCSEGACLDPSADNSAGALPILGSSGASKKQWVEVGVNLQCDGYDGEVYLKSSRGKVPTLAACKASCESAKGCESISYFKSGWCSHWASPCKKTKYSNKVVVSLRFTSAPVAVPPAPVGAPTWTEVGAKLECNGHAGEVYLQSSRGQVPTLAACKASCEKARVCKSISYFKSGWCSHWGTPCKKTRINKKVVVSLGLTYVKKVDLSDLVVVGKNRRLNTESI